MSTSSNAARYACDPIVFAPRGIVMLADDSDSSWLQVHFQLFRLVGVHVGQRLHSRLTVLSYR